MHNDKEIGPIIHERGLRQGDPLSPYLFLLCAEGLTSLVSDFERRQLIHVCKVASRCPSVTQLFFADDSCLFLQENVVESGKIKEVLQLYEKASGQSVNFQKSNVCCISNASVRTRQEVCFILQVPESRSQGFYLGLPSLVESNKNVVFCYIKDKVWKRISGWKNHFFSRATKEILVKMVA